MTDRLPVIFIVGPTAVGKSAIAVALAALVNAEIVSCDAMQVYREAHIASDKPSLDLQRHISHHLIDVVSVTEEFSAARYRALASAAVAGIHARGKVPLVVGGSGMYMMALLDGLFEGEVSPDLRAALLAADPTDLYTELQQVDPAAAAAIPPGNVRRVARALEVYKATGTPFSQAKQQRKGFWGKYAVRIFGLERSREELYRRAEARIDAMFAGGLVEEVQSLRALPLSSTGARIIGLPEVKGAVDGLYAIDHAGYLMKLHTRHYVKRQMTWFRKDKRIEWLTLASDETPGATADRIYKQIRG